MSQLRKTLRGGVGIAFLAGFGLGAASLVIARGAEPSASLDPLANVQSEATPVTHSSEELGELFNSTVGGISIRPPKGMRQLVRLDQKILAQWTNDTHSLILRRIKLEQATPLTTEKHFGKSVEGVLEMTFDTLQNELPGAKVLRKDLTSVANAEPAVQSDPDPDPDEKAKPNVGLIVVRYSTGGVPQLKQQALIRASSYLYYMVEYTTPGSKANDDKTEDPNERLAVETFGRVLGSVRLIDTSKVREEQEKSLFATSAFLVNITPTKLRRAIVPEQWFRILKDGRDVGYTYVMEQTAGGLPQPDEETVKRARAGQLSDEEKSRPFLLPKMTPGDDILIGVKSRMIVDGLRGNKTTGPIQTDSESWMFVTVDCKHEDWSRLIVQHDATRPKDLWSEELGTSDQHLVGLKKGATLTVTQNANAVNLEPINQEVPPFYLPAAIGHILPRLLDLKSQKEYAFASFIGDRREVVMRYYTVGPAEQVELDGTVFKVIPISDRVGFDGPPTFHYVAADPGPDGRHRYLGSENKQTNTLVVASDQPTIEKIFANAGSARRRANAPIQGPPTPESAVSPAPLQQ